MTSSSGQKYCRTDDIGTSYSKSNRVAEISDGCAGLWASDQSNRPGYCVADRRLNVEITPALAERQGRLRHQDVVRDRAAGPARIGHLEEGGHNIIAVVLVGREQAVFDEEHRPIARALSRPFRARGSDVWRRRQNDLPVIGRYQLNPGTARSPVIDKALAVPLGARSVFLVVDVPAKLLFKPRRHRHEWCHPAWLRRLAGRHHVEPGTDRIT